MARYEVKVEYIINYNCIDFITVEAADTIEAAQKVENIVIKDNTDDEATVGNIQILNVREIPEDEYYYVLITISEKSHNTYIDFFSHKRGNFSKQAFMESLYKEIERRVTMYKTKNGISTETPWTYEVEDASRQDYLAFCSFER